MRTLFLLVLVTNVGLGAGCIKQIKEAKVRAAFEEIWVDKDMAAIDRHYAPDVAQAARQFALESQALWPDAQVTIGDVRIDGDTFVVRWEVTGHHRDLGTEVTLRGVNVVKVKGTTVVEEERYFDNMTVYDQLGYMLVPPEDVPASPAIDLDAALAEGMGAAEAESTPEPPVPDQPAPD